MRLSACWLAFAAFAASRSCSRCCSVRFWLCSMARSRASALFASWPSRPARSSSSFSDCCRSASDSSDFAIFSSAACAAAFSASLIAPASPDSPSSFDFSSSSSDFADAKSPRASASANSAVSPSCGSRPARSFLIAAFAFASSLWRSSSRRFWSAPIRLMPSRRASSGSSISPPTFDSAFSARPAIASRTSSGSAFALSTSWRIRSMASSASFRASATGSTAAGSSVAHSTRGTMRSVTIVAAITASATSARPSMRTGNAARTFAPMPPADATDTASATAARA